MRQAASGSSAVLGWASRNRSKSAREIRHCTPIRRAGMAPDRIHRLTVWRVTRSASATSWTRSICSILPIITDWSKTRKLFRFRLRVPDSRAIIIFMSTTTQEDMTPIIKTSWTTLSQSAPQEQGGRCYADYMARLTISIESPDGQRSAASRDTGGWVVCGWIEPGANADLDGSGLALWGNSQPGGWTWCASDSQESGTPRVEADDACVRIKSPNEIDQVIDLKELAPWASAEELEELADRIADQAGEPSPSGPDEPSANTLADALGCDEKNPVVMGDWEGAGRVLVWLGEGGDYRSTYWPSEYEVREACVNASKDWAERLAAEIIPDLRDEDY